MPPNKAFKCVADVTLRKVFAHNVCHTHVEQYYLTIELFHVLQRTRPRNAAFPLLINENYVFEKYFLTPTDPREVARLLEDIPVRIELRSVLGHQREGPLLAYYETNARQFLYPFRSMAIQTRDREIVLNKTEEFHGQSPVVEFSTYTVLQETPLPVSPVVRDSYFGDLSHAKPRTPPFSCRHVHPICPCHQSCHHIHHGSDGHCHCAHSTRPAEPLISHTKAHKRTKKSHSKKSHHRTPSPEPAILDYRPPDAPQRAELNDSWSVPYDRPPFVVRKAHYNLLGRIPVLGNSFHDAAHRKVYSKRFQARSVSPIRYKATWCEQHLLSGPGRNGCDACRLLQQRWNAEDEANRIYAASDEDEYDVKSKRHQEKGESEKMEKVKTKAKHRSSEECSSSASSSSDSHESSSSAESCDSESEDDKKKTKSTEKHTRYHIPRASSARLMSHGYYHHHFREPRDYYSECY